MVGGLDGRASSGLGYKSKLGFVSDKMPLAASGAQRV
jgi:hypothetical protein